MGDGAEAAVPLAGRLRPTSSGAVDLNVDRLIAPARMFARRVPVMPPLPGSARADSRIAPTRVFVSTNEG